MIYDEDNPVESMIIPLRRANCPYTLINTREEDRVVSEIRQGFAKTKICKTVYLWSMSLGTVHDLMMQTKTLTGIDSFYKMINWFTKIDGDEISRADANHNMDVANYNIQTSPLIRSVLLIQDLCPVMVDDGSGNSNPTLARLIKNSRDLLTKYQRSILILAHTDYIPPELNGYMSMLKYPTPGKKWIRRIVEDVANSEIRGSKTVPAMNLTEDEYEKVASELIGMLSMEIDEALTMANSHNAIQTLRDPTVKRQFDLEVIRRMKAKAMDQSASLEVIYPKGGMELIGGNNGLKKKLDLIRPILKPEAREDGIPMPKGFLLIGPGGTGKTQSVKSIAKSLDLQMYRLDIGACKGSLLGQSEGNLRRALDTINRLAPCLLFLDEFEKMWAGISGETMDGGVTQGMMASWLHWMSEGKKPDVFVVAACNSIKGIPGPVIRCERFDDNIYVPLPGPKAREEIFKIHFGLMGWDANECEIDMKKVIHNTKGYSGAEIKTCTTKALQHKVQRIGFGRDKKPSTADVLEAINSVIPLSRTHSTEIIALEEWAQKHGCIRSSDEPFDFDIYDLAKGNLGVNQTTGFSAPEPKGRTIESF